MLEISRKNSNVNNLQGSGKYPESERGARGPRGLALLPRAGCGWRLQRRFTASVYIHRVS